MKPLNIIIHSLSQITMVQPVFLCSNSWGGNNYNEGYWVYA